MDGGQGPARRCGLDRSIDESVNPAPKWPVQYIGKRLQRVSLHLCMSERNFYA